MKNFLAKWFFAFLLGLTKIENEELKKLNLALEENIELRKRKAILNDERKKYL